MRPTLRVGTVYDFRNTPESGMEMPSLYAAIMDQVVMLDGLGLELVWFTEHHFLDDGYLPSWVPMAGAIAARTKRVRLSSDVCLLPFNHPVRLAEDLAVLDNISNGRIEVGVGMGYAPHEFCGFGLPVARRARHAMTATPAAGRAVNGARSVACNAEGVGPQPRQLSRRHHPLLPRDRRARSRVAGRARRRALSRPSLSQLQQGGERRRRRFGQHAGGQHPADMGGRQCRALREGADILRARIRHHRPRHLGSAAGHAARADERQSRTLRARRGAPRQSRGRGGLGRKEGRRMGVGIGLGCAEFPFSGAAAYWRWIDMCEAGGVDSIWQTDRIVSRQPFLASMTTMAALAGRT